MKTFFLIIGIGVVVLLGTVYYQGTLNPPGDENSGQASIPEIPAKLGFEAVCSIDYSEGSGAFFSSDGMLFQGNFIVQDDAGSKYTSFVQTPDTTYVWEGNRDPDTPPRFAYTFATNNMEAHKEHLPNFETEGEYFCYEKKSGEERVTYTPPEDIQFEEL